MYTIRFFAWCNEGTSDKIWGFVEFHDDTGPTNITDKVYRWDRPTPKGSLYNFWGRRGKSYSFKRHFGTWGLHDLRRLAEKKTNPSGDKTPYVEVDLDKIDTICPGFLEEFENQFMAAKFSGKIKSDDVDNHTFI